MEQRPIPSFGTPKRNVNFVQLMIGSLVKDIGINVPQEIEQFDKLMPGTYSFHLTVIVNQENSDKSINMPIDAVVMPKIAKAGVTPPC